LGANSRNRRCSLGGSASRVSVGKVVVVAGGDRRPGSLSATSDRGSLDSISSLYGLAGNSSSGRSCDSLLSTSITSNRCDGSSSVGTSISHSGISAIGREVDRCNNRSATSAGPSWCLGQGVCKDGAHGCQEGGGKEKQEHSVTRELNGMMVVEK